jgi:hypothetical protein
MYYPTFKEEATPMKQTAVEWLYNNLKSHFEHNGDLLEVVQMSFEQAKEMEKQQERDACGLALSKLLYKQALKSEISDEEIEKGAKDWYAKEGSYTPSIVAIKTWVRAIKWYKEQLKK